VGRKIKLLKKAATQEGSYSRRQLLLEKAATQNQLLLAKTSYYSQNQLLAKPATTTRKTSYSQNQLLAKPDTRRDGSQ
jgi:hypothetical protein